MKYLSLIILTCFIVSTSFSQTVKVKKDKVLFDGIPVATVKVKKRDYTYTSLNNSNTIIVRLKPSPTGENETLVVTDVNGRSSEELPMEWYSVSINYKKGIAELMAKKYNLITDNGIENVAAFFDKDASEEMTEVDEETMESAVEDYENKLKNNRNIQGQRGYVVDASGQKWEGIVSLEHEKFYDPRKDWAGYKLASKTALNGVLDYTDENGQKAQKIFKAKSGDRVCVFNDDGSETCFVGIKLKTDKVLTEDSNIGDVLNSSSFYEIAYEGINTMVFKHPTEDTELGIKRNDKKEAIVFVGSNIARNKNNVNRYLECTIPDEFVNTDYTKAKAIIAIVKHYENNCN